MELINNKDLMERVLKLLKYTKLLLTPQKKIKNLINKDWLQRKTKQKLRKTIKEELGKIRIRTLNFSKDIEKNA